MNVFYCQNCVNKGKTISGISKRKACDLCKWTESTGFPTYYCEPMTNIHLIKG